MLGRQFARDAGIFRRLPRIALLAGGFAMFLGVFLGVTPTGVAVQEKEKEEKAKETEELDPDEVEEPAFPPYIDLVRSEYLPAKDAKGKQRLRLRLTLTDSVPVGSRINFELQYTGLTVEETVFELKNRRRKGIVFEWRPKKPLAPEKFALFTLLRLEEQTLEVQKAIRARPKAFPLDRNPWALYFFEDEDLIDVGTEEEKEAFKGKICATYDGLIAELGANNDEAVETYEDVLSGKKFARRNSVDTKALNAFARKWQLKQSVTQKKILLMPDTHTAIHQKSLTAHQNLARLGLMVSRRIVKLEKQIETKFGVTIQVVPQGKKDEDLRYFQSSWRYSTTKKALINMVEKIYQLTCPEEEEEEAGGAKSSDGGKSGGGKKGSSKTGGDGKKKRDDKKSTKSKKSKSSKSKSREKD